MIDWHSHILPKMDDGSRSTAESRALIGMQAAQGVDTVIATPHFYADNEAVDSFLNRRAKALDLLKSEFPDNPLRVVLGAEVKYYPGISRLTDLKRLRIEGSKLLLLEMPVSGWSESTLRELMEMNTRGSTRIILAHAERYPAFRKREVRERIAGSGILVQCNAGFFVSRFSKRRAFSLLEEGQLHLLGSDCHNTTARPPKIGQAFESIRKNFGEEYLLQMDKYSHSLLHTAAVPV